MDSFLATALEFPLGTHLGRSIYPAGTSLVSNPPHRFNFLTRSQAHTDNMNIPHANLGHMLLERSGPVPCPQGSSHEGLRLRLCHLLTAENTDGPEVGGRGKGCLNGMVLRQPLQVQLKVSKRDSHFEHHVLGKCGWLIGSMRCVWLPSRCQDSDGVVEMGNQSS